MAEIRARILSLNCRRSSYLPDRLYPSRYWPNRRGYLVKAIQAAGPSIIGAQECTVEQDQYIRSHLSPNWTSFGGVTVGNVVIMWDGLKWDAIDQLEVPLPSDDHRMLTAVRLASRPPKNPGTLWVANVHLTVGSTAAKIKWRTQQIRSAIRTIQELDGSEHSLICGDFNDDCTRQHLGPVRTIAAELGYKDIRTTLPNDRIQGDSYSSRNAWKRTPQEDRWIDDILTPKNVEPYSAFLEFTCLRRYPKCGSDHNGIRASVAWNGKEILP